MKSDGRFDQVIGLARQAEALRLSRVEATRVRSHRAPRVARVYVAALTTLGFLILSTGSAVVASAAGPGAVVTTVGRALATTALPTKIWVCCVVTPAHAPVVVEAQSLRVQPALRQRPNPNPAAVPSTPTPPAPSPTPTPARTATPVVLPVVLPVAPTVTPPAAPSATPTPTPTPLASSPSPTPTPTSSSHLKVHRSADPGCALPPS